VRIRLKTVYGFEARSSAVAFLERGSELTNARVEMRRSLICGPQLTLLDRVLIKASAEPGRRTSAIGGLGRSRY
jgi:hypothetical protein